VQRRDGHARQVVNLFGRQHLAAINTVIRHRRSLKVGGPNNLCGPLSRGLMPTLSSHPQALCTIFPRISSGCWAGATSCELSFATSLHRQVDRELPVVWRLDASPRSDAARRSAREPRRYLACCENVPSLHKHSRSSPCPPTLLNNSQTIPTPPLSRYILPNLPQIAFTTYDYNNDTRKCCWHIGTSGAILILGRAKRAPNPSRYSWFRAPRS
jgi:hypothetical protein